MIDVALSFVGTRLHEDNTKTSLAAPEERFALEFDHNGDSPRVLWRLALTSQTNVPGGEGGGEGIARQASGKIAGREGRRPEERE